MMKIKPDPRFAHIDARINAEVGIGNYGETRHAVEQVNFAGGNITYIEGPGVLSRVFSFHGNAESIYYLRAKLEPEYSGSAAARDFFKRLLAKEQQPAAARKPAAPKVSASGRAFAESLDKAEARFLTAQAPRR